ncbi:hypothetical protein BHL84_09720 [Limosilactobacillus reuteri]|nr:hypothetical protein BHL84_09720 [Limosilactobacillus reuteri]
MVDCKINLNAVRTKKDQLPLKWCSIVLKELDNSNYNRELNAINEAQAKLYEALKSLEIE